MRPFFLLLLAGALLSSPGSLAVTVIHTNDVMGDIEPCGCRNNPQGGMARKANLLKRIKDPSLLQLDAGDLLFSSDSVPEMLTKQSEVQAGYLLKAHELLKHDAIVPGEKDFALGFATFEKLRKKSPIRFLAANLRKRNGGTLFEPSAIFERKSPDGKTVKIGVIGLVGEDLMWPKELKATPALAAARREVKALRDKVDFLIGLTHQGYDRDISLARKVRGFDFIIGGHSQAFLQRPIKEGKTWIFQSSFRNQYIGVIPLAKNWNPETYELTGLDAGYQSPENAPGPVDKLVAEFKTKIADLNSHKDSALLGGGKKSEAGDRRYQTFPHCAGCHFKQFDFWRKTKHVQALSALIEKQQSKNKECLECHTVGLGDKQGLRDVNRLAEWYSDANRDADKTEALSQEDLAAYLKVLHESASLKDKVRIRPGAEERTLSQSVSLLARAWTPVQCENCHQPGRDHPFSGVYSKKVETSECLKCHTPERAPEWYIKTTGKPDWELVESKRKQMTCPAGDLTPEEE